MEKSPWWGGFYERMVRSVKRCLKKVLRNARLTYEELLTLLIRVEGVLNSRPLTYVYPDQDEPLTPSHLVLGKRILTVPTPGELVGEEEGRNELLKRDKHLKNVSLAEHEYMNIAPPPPNHRSSYATAVCTSSWSAETKAQKTFNCFGY